MSKNQLQNPFDNKWEHGRITPENASPDERAVLNAGAMYLIFKATIHDDPIKIIMDNYLYLAAFDAWRNQNREAAGIFDQIIQYVFDCREAQRPAPEFMLAALVDVFHEVERMANGENNTQQGR